MINRPTVNLLMAETPKMNNPLNIQSGADESFFKDRHVMGLTQVHVPKSPPIQESESAATLQHKFHQSSTMTMGEVNTALDDYA